MVHHKRTINHYELLKDLRRLFPNSQGYQDWLVHIGTEVSQFEYQFSKYLELPSQEKAVQFVQSLGDKRIGQWHSRLEDYEILFPETANLREELFKRDTSLYNFFSRFVEILKGKPEQWKVSIGDFEKETKRLVTEQGALFSELLIYFQNRCLNQFRSHAIPQARHGDPSLPGIIEDTDGNLTIREPEEKGGES